MEVKVGEVKRLQERGRLLKNRGLKRVLERVLRKIR